MEGRRREPYWDENLTFGFLRQNRNVGLTEKQRQNDDELLPSTKDDMDSITEYKRCLLTNGPSSSCPNMAAGKLSQPLQVQRFLSGYS